MIQNVSIRTGFQPVTYNINFDKEKIRKGKDLAKTHVKRVEELHALGACKLIRCSCIRTYNVQKPPYAVKLDLNDARTITHRSCSCMSGRAGKCKHIYALIHYINTDRSKTKTAHEQGWDKPSDSQLGKDTYAKPLVLAEKYKPNNNFADAEPYDVSLEDLKDIDCPLRNILRVENMKKEDLLARANMKIELKKGREQQENINRRECVMMLIENSPRHDELYCCNTGELKLFVKQFFETHVKVAYHTVFETCINTVNQSQSRLWFDVRNIRISASSRAHKIKTRTKKSSNELAKDFLKTDKKVSIPAMEYGKKHEKRAVREYVENYKKVVRHVGVFIMPLQPWICGSPDGIVIEGNTPKILEIKCPASCEYKPIFDKNTKKFNVSYLTSVNGTMCLKESNEYYSQCQLLVYITGLKECDFYVWSPKGSELVSVPKNEIHLQKNIPKIEEFYFQTFLPVLLDSNKEDENNTSNA